MNSTNIHINNIHIAVVKRPPNKPLLTNTDRLPPTDHSDTAHAKLFFPRHLNQKTLKDKLKTKPLYFELVDTNTSAQVGLHKVDDIGDYNALFEQALPVYFKFPPFKAESDKTFNYTIAQLPPADGSDYDRRSFRVVVTWARYPRTTISYPDGEPRFLYVLGDDSKPPQPNINLSYWMFDANGKLSFFWYEPHLSYTEVKNRLKSNPLIFELVDDDTMTSVGLCIANDIDTGEFKYLGTRYMKLDFPPIMIKSPGTHHYTMSQVAPANDSKYDSHKFSVSVTTSVGNQTLVVNYQPKTPIFYYM